MPNVRRAKPAGGGVLRDLFLLLGAMTVLLLVFALPARALAESPASQPDTTVEDAWQSTGTGKTGNNGSWNLSATGKADNNVNWEASASGLTENDATQGSSATGNAQSNFSWNPSANGNTEPSGSDQDASTADDPQDEQPAPPQEPAAVEVTWLFLKTDEAGNPLANVTMELRDAHGTALQTFVTGEDERELTETLTVGDTYLLHEVSAPAGYTLADDLAFAVELDEDGEPCVVQRGTDGRSKDGSMIVMRDARLQPLRVAKRDANGKPLAGATLTLVDVTTGTTVESWTSTTEEHEIAADRLHAGHTYRLSEEKAPDGYDACDPIEFALGRDGSVTGLTTKKAAYDRRAHTFIVTNDPTPEPEDPEDPEEPDQPDDPNDPVDPEDPETPTDPDDPTAPKKTTSEKPVAPKATSTSKRDQPATATSAPATSPAASTTQTSASLPQTGDERPNVIPLALAGTCLVGVGVFLALRRL